LPTKGRRFTDGARAGTNQMWFLKLIDRLIEGRRHRWVEISLSRAWSRDVTPRLVTPE